MILEIKELFAGYEKNIVLKDINLNINKGEIVGILGPNGAGKTTLFKTITRIIKPFSGKIYFEGKDIFKIDLKKYSQNVAAVSQNFQSLEIVVRDFVLLGRVPYFKRFHFFETKKDEEIAEKYMKITGIFYLQNKSLSQISSGERQLCIISKALTQQPKLLLLDEPVSHLDIEHQIKIMDLIKNFNKKMGLTILIILHDLNLASQYCDKLVLMKKGQIVKIGTPLEVIKPELIKKVYNASVLVKKHPLTKKPYILLFSKTRS